MEYNKRNSENSLLQVHFGKNGSTHISIGSALTIKEALEKPMKLRELVPEMCGAYVRRGITKTPLSWETRISKIKKETIYVEETGFGLFNCPIVSKNASFHYFPQKYVIRARKEFIMEDLFVPLAIMYFINIVLKVCL